MTNIDKIVDLHKDVGTIKKERELLTLDQLKAFPDGDIFATGITTDNPMGCNMTGSGRNLRWVAKKGTGYDDWAIYCGWEDDSFDYVMRHGQKAASDVNIISLVPCTAEVLERYRK